MTTVWMRNPALPGNAPVEVDEAAFDGVWRLRGWESCDPPRDPAEDAEPAAEDPADAQLPEGDPQPEPEPAKPAKRRRKTAASKPTPDEPATSGDHPEE